MPTPTFLNILIVIQLNGKIDTCFEYGNEELPKQTQSYRTWSESGVVKLRNNFTPKLENCGHVCIFVRYAEIHNDGVNKNVQ